MKKIRVLQISNYMYPNYGGTEQVARDFANAMSKIDEVEQKIICFNSDAEAGEYKCRRNETVHDVVDGVEVIRCGCFVKIFSQSLSTTYAKELKKVLQEFKPHLVVLHYPNPFVTSILLKYKNQPFKLWIYWHLDITKQKLIKKLFKSQNLQLIERSDKVLGATPKHVNESEFTYAFGDKKEVLPYAIDEQRLVISDVEKEVAAQIREKYKGRMLGFFIGRHVPYKGLEYLIDASKYVSDDFHFVIAGSGELTEELKKKAAGDSKIEFVGRISDSEWRSYLWACDIFCFPSVTRNEGFGLALAEGMYYGKPAVTFTIPGSGVNYVNLDGVTGIECPNCDSKAYAEALMKLHDDTELRERYGAAARERILNNFTVAQFEKNVKKIICDQI